MKAVCDERYEITLLPMKGMEKRCTLVEIILVETSYTEYRFAPECMMLVGFGRPTL